MTQTTKPQWELKLERTISAPLERVWRAWEDPKEVARWFAPRPLTLRVDKMELKTGGQFAMAMVFPDGNTHEFSGVYREVEPRKRIVWTGEFPGDPKDNMRTEITFTAQGAKTRIDVHQTFEKITPFNEKPLQGAKQGWTMTLDQLTEAVEGAAR